MTVKGGRLDFLAPHLLRSQILRPGFVRLSLRLGVAQQMPQWAKLQFTNSGVSPDDLERVLGRITSLGSWVDEWEALGRMHEQGGQDALALGRTHDASRRFLAASAAYNFAQYVIFLDIDRKRALHAACVRAYAQAAPLVDPPARPFEVAFRRQLMRGYLRLPKGLRPAERVTARGPGEPVARPPDRDTFIALFDVVAWAGATGDSELGLPHISLALAEAVLARRGPDNVHTTVIGDNVSPADIAAIARRPANGGSPAVGLAGYAAVSPQLSYVDWRDEVLGLAAELSDGRLLRCP